MNKKYYLLTMLLLGGVGVACHENVKAAESQASDASGTVKNHKDTNVLPASNAQDDSASFPTISRIDFSGNQTISSEILRQAIPLQVQNVANEHIIMDSMVKIAQLYKVKNIKVTITPILEKSSINSRNIQFDIHESPIDK